MLKLDDKVSNYIKDLPEEWVSVSIRQLLTHTSGIPDYEDIASYDVYGKRLTMPQIIKIAHSRPMDFKPGVSWKYSNTGYYLLSILASKVTKLSFAESLKKYILIPAGMEKSGLSNPEEITPQRASGYARSQSGNLINKKATEATTTLGAGGMISTVGDLIKWHTALSGNKILTKSSKILLWTSTILKDGSDTGYGFGWVVKPFNNTPRQGHNGMVPGFSSSFTRFPNHDLVVIILQNVFEASDFELRTKIFQVVLDIEKKG